nr:alcohol dehydrogenase catalytic domain-containing protein [Saccharothrix mutabilis subsp. capreolus]
MRATLMYGAGDVRVEQVPDPVLKHPADAVVRITASCVCGSDLHPYGSMPPADRPARMGHEFIGIVEDTGAEVATGDLVVAPFAISDNTCAFCREGLHTSCAHPQPGFWDGEPEEGGQAEAIRVPLADGTLVKLPVAPDSALIPSLLIILMGRHRERTDLGREFGATDVVAARGEEGIAAVRDLTGGRGTPVVQEAVGPPARLRPGRRRAATRRCDQPRRRPAVRGRPIGFGSLFRHNLRLAGGPAPVRAYIGELMPAILDGTIDPGRVFDTTTDLDGVPDAYRAMADRRSLKVLITP